MSIKRLAGIAVILLALIIGCAGNYARIIAPSDAADKITLNELKDNWEDYDIYFGRRTASYADAIMFDPKDNNTKLTGDSWIKIEDRKTLDERLNDIHLKYRNAEVHLIEGADNQLFGYMYYSAYFHIGLKIVDEQTLFVYRLPPPRSTP